MNFQRSLVKTIGFIITIDWYLICVSGSNLFTEFLVFKPQICRLNKLVLTASHISIFFSKLATSLPQVESEASNGKICFLIKKKKQNRQLYSLVYNSM